MSNSDIQNIGEHPFTTVTLYSIENESQSSQYPRLVPGSLLGKGCVGVWMDCRAIYMIKLSSPYVYSTTLSYPNITVGLPILLHLVVLTLRVTIFS